MMSVDILQKRLDAAYSAIEMVLKNEDIKNGASGKAWDGGFVIRNLRQVLTGHVTRYSDSSLYDEKCIICGATDERGHNHLNDPCKKIITGEGSHG